MVASGNFEAPMDAVASPDGATFYFSAYDVPTDPNTQSTAAIFAVDATGGTPSMLVNDSPMEDPSGLLLSCDGSTLYIADLSYSAGDVSVEDEIDTDKSALYTLDIDSRTLAPLAHGEIAEAAGLAFDTDCENLYVTGYTADGTPALFKMSPEGGDVTIVKQGEPLESPSGVYVDRDHVAWVMDHLPSNQLGGALWAITEDGTTSVVVDGLEISAPAGVSLVAGGQIAVIPSRNIDGEGQLLTADTKTGEMTVVEAPQMLEPAGIRTALKAQVMAVVDADGDAIYRAE